LNTITNLAYGGQDVLEAIFYDKVDYVSGTTDMKKLPIHVE
jgi:hypothetical protein